MYKPLADSTLMNMTKKEIIEQLRIAEHNFRAIYQCFSYDTVDSRYCPHCGAKMDGDTK